jgi:hypothetical protein
MRDFQAILRLMIEGDEAAAADPGAAPSVTLDAATTPSQAYMAYRREASKLIGDLEFAMAQADKQLAAMSGHASAYKDTVKTKDQLQQHLGQFQTATPRPTIDRSKIAAMVGKYKGAAPAAPAPSPTT